MVTFLRWNIVISITVVVLPTQGSIQYTFDKMGHALENIAEAHKEQQNIIHEIKQLHGQAKYEKARLAGTDKVARIIQQAVANKDTELAHMCIDIWPDRYPLFVDTYEKYISGKRLPMTANNETFVAHVESLPGEHIEYAFVFEPLLAKAHLFYQVLFAKENSNNMPKQLANTQKNLTTLQTIASYPTDQTPPDYAMNAWRVRGKTIVYTAIEHGRYEYVRSFTSFVEQYTSQPIPLKKHKNEQTSSLLHDMMQALSDNPDSVELQTSLVEGITYAAQHNLPLIHNGKDSIFAKTDIPEKAKNYMAAACVFGAAIEGVALAEEFDKCTICQYLLVSPPWGDATKSTDLLHTTKCTSKFHKFCLDKHVEEKKKKFKDPQCPHCRRYILYNPKKNELAHPNNETVKIIKQENTTMSPHLTYFLQHLKEQKCDLEYVCNLSLRGISEDPTRLETPLCKLMHIETDAAEPENYVPVLYTYWSQETLKKEKSA